MKSAMLCLFSLLVVASGCIVGRTMGSGRVVEETRDVGEFNAIDLRISGDMHVAIGKATPLKLRGDDNVLPLIQTEIKDGRLIIKSEESYSTRQTLTLSVGVASLNAVHLLGSGDIRIVDLDAKMFDARLLGSGDLDIAGTADTLSVDVLGSGDLLVQGLKSKSVYCKLAGSGDVVLSGAVDQFDVEILGSGDVHAFGLDATRSKVAVSGSGDIELSSRDALDATILGSGDVHYLGSPKVRRSVTGSGEIHQAAKASQPAGSPRE